MERYGWEEDPLDAQNIIRARTKLGQLRVWKFPREVTTKINGLDFAGAMDHPGLYILLNGGGKSIYVGETGDLKTRLNTHNKTPPKELTDWHQVVVLNDGRNYAQSIFTDQTLRLFLEKKLIRLIETSGLFKPVNRVKEEPKMSMATKSVAEKTWEELALVLTKLGLAIDGPVEIINEDELSVDNIKAILSYMKDMKPDKIVRDQFIISGIPFFYRPGTAPRTSEKGWHITLRIKPRESLGEGKGGLIINRGKGYLIEAEKMKEWLGQKLWPIEKGKEAIDLYADLHNEKLFAVKDHPPLDLKPFRLSD
jgi:predicted GIY-YIG superfamily endonuclease